MWSEHCSYKSSRKHLKKFPTEGKHLLVGPGENAGIVDIGGGYAAAFKIESHNHPSFIEPFQGAATGVGGILRDIFTMGARPIAVMDSLRFGPLDDPLIALGHHANAVALPQTADEIVFRPGKFKAPLFNGQDLGHIPANHPANMHVQPMVVRTAR
jgi:phosphoribosylformylglycinamidine synthase